MPHNNPLLTGKDFIDDLPIPEEVRIWIERRTYDKSTGLGILVNKKIQSICEDLWRMMYRQVFSAQQTMKIELDGRDQIIADLKNTIQETTQRLKDLTEWIDSHM